MKLALVPAGPCEWRAQGRILGRVELSLEDGDAGWLEQDVALLAGSRIGRVFHSPDELVTNTARRLAERLSAATRADDELLEINVGLWAGLARADLKSRFASAFRQLSDDPLAVSPPHGEGLAAGADRVCSAIRKHLRKVRKAGEVSVFVLRPLALAAAVCAFERGGDFGALWTLADGPDEPRLIETALDGQAAGE
jgi:broad specificity phosphatase PhoE